MTTPSINTRNHERPGNGTPEVGVLMLDNRIPRPPGDVGNPVTFDYPIAYQVIPGADTRRVVEQNAIGLAEESCHTARQLCSEGIRGLATCCGFLAIYQDQLAAAVDVPVATSSLLQIPLVLRMLKPDQQLIVLTVNASTLTPQHFAGAGVEPDQLQRITVVGLENTEHFYPMIIGRITELDTARAEAEVVAATRAALQIAPDAGAFIFECTNLPPYANAVRSATGLPVWDATSLIDWLHGGVTGDRAARDHHDADHDNPEGQE